MGADRAAKGSIEAWDCCFAAAAACCCWNNDGCGVTGLDAVCEELNPEKRE